MSRRGYSTEQIIHKLREAEVLLSKGQKVPEVFPVSDNWTIFNLLLSLFTVELGLYFL